MSTDTVAQERSEAPFWLPVNLTDLASTGFYIAFCAMALTSIVVVAAKWSGCSTISFLTLLEDVAFLALRGPAALRIFRAEAWISPWSVPLVLAASALFVMVAHLYMAGFCRGAAQKRQPAPATDANKPETFRGLALSFLFLLVVCGGVWLWFRLRAPADSLVLRLVRLVSLGFFVQLGAMLLGGALACCQTEPVNSAGALARMLRLARSRPGAYLRAAVFTLPQWMVLSSLGWYFVAGTLGLLLLVPARLFPEAWFQAAWNYAAGLTSHRPGDPVSVALAAIEVLAVVAVPLGLAIVLVLFPLSSGAWLFCLLHSNGPAEQREPAAVDSTTGGGARLTRWGRVLFAPGAPTALAHLKPPRGWAPLALLGLRPRLVLIAGPTGCLLLVLANKYSHWATVAPAMVVLAVLCRQVGRLLAPGSARTSAWFVPLHMIAGFLYLIVLLATFSTPAAIGTCLGLISGTGPILWSAMLLFSVPFLAVGLALLIAGAAFALALFPAAAMLPPSEKDPFLVDKLEAVLVAPWGFTGAVLAGLPWAMLPALVAAGLAFATNRHCCDALAALWAGRSAGSFKWLQHLASGTVLGLALLGLAIALTNAYLAAVRESADRRSEFLARLGGCARFVSMSAPDSVAPGQQFTATVVMQNTGTTTWQSVALHASHPYRLGSQDPQDNLVWGIGRVELPSAQVSPGESATLTLTGTAPLNPRTYPFSWKMLQERVEWFGDTGRKNIAVGNRSGNSSSPPRL
ncbi:MAG: NBR1-Ig-like domain-containing protein [Acidobacteriota bacterium]